jgi:hypothetical protein
MADEGKTTIVETGGNGGAIALLAIAIIAVAVVLFLMFGQNLLSNTKTVNADIKVDTPAKP